MRIHVEIHKRRNLHVREHIREQEVRIKGAGVCIEICVYIWMQAREVGEVRNEDVDGKQSRHVSGVMRTSIGTVT